MVCTAGSSGVRRPPWEVLPSRIPIVQRPRADCEDDPEPGTRTSRKKGLAQGAAIRRPHQAQGYQGDHAILANRMALNYDPPWPSYDRNTQTCPLSSYPAGHVRTQAPAAVL